MTNVMKISVLCILLLSTGIFIAVFLAVFSGIVSVSNRIEPFPQPSTGHKNPFSALKISDSYDNLFWFLQISDLHISSFQDEKRASSLKQFCDSTVAIIEPSVVLASGDLTDAKEPDNVGSRQILEEWKTYSDILSNCKSLKKVKWLDIRGNHDNFDVPGSGSSRNFYQNFSQVGGKGHSFAHSVTSSSGSTFTFIGLDACPDQGLRRPFNFVGLLRDKDVTGIRKLIASQPHTDYFIWFGHYPTSCILSRHNKVRQMIGEDRRSLVYLCGHLHTLGGLVPNMYTLQHQGFLELELADWKDNRMYRLMAIDHGLFSFVDVKFEEWPVILVTNPKQPIFSSDREPIANIASSDHIRVMVFSPGKVLHVGVSLNNNEWQPCRHVKGPLFVLPWDPSSYPPGLNVIKVSAVDELGNEKTLIHQFSLDGTQLSFNLLGRICLMTNISSVSQLLFGLMVVGVTLPLCFFRFLKKKMANSSPDADVFAGTFWIFRIWFKRFWILSNIDRLFYPIVFYPLYLTIGPWFVGELIRGYTGVIFVWGIFINNSFLPGAFTYTFALKQLLLFHWVFVVIAAIILDLRVCGYGEIRGKTMLQFLCHSFMLVLVLSQVYLLYYFWLAYGTAAVLLGPFRLYPLVLYIYTWYTSHSIPLTDIRDVIYPFVKES